MVLLLGESPLIQLLLTTFVTLYSAKAILLEQKIVDLDLLNSVLLPGHISNPYKVMDKAAMFVSSSRWEGLPNAVLEAMACGTAVISSNCSSIPEVAGNSAILIDPYSVEELSEKWQLLLEDETLRKGVVKKCQQQAKEFTWERCIKSTIDVYKEIQHG